MLPGIQRLKRSLALPALVWLAGLSGSPAGLRADSLLDFFWQKKNNIIVSSTADDDYTLRKFGASAAKPESYLFFQGTFYGGKIRDPDLERAQFTSIVQVLGRDLVKQNYLPSANIRDADLLIVVHWGTTETYQEEFVINWQPLDPDHPNNRHDADHLMLGLDHAQHMADDSNTARLLGYGQQLSAQQAKKPAGFGPDERKLSQSLSRERYFVILMAYDYRTMKKGTRPKLLWSTRFSVESPGNSFTSALPAMSKIAADYFGHAEGLRSVSTGRLREGTVKLGPLEILGEAPANLSKPEPDKATK